MQAVGLVVLIGEAQLASPQLLVVMDWYASFWTFRASSF
jgi:hypothetical protein